MHDRPWKKIGRTQEGRSPTVDRSTIHVDGCTRLDNLALPHHAQLIRHRQSVLLIMEHTDDR